MSTEKPKFNLKNPCITSLKREEIITKPGSGKDTRHYEISLNGSGMEFLPGDSLAVKPTNCPDLVSDLLQTLGLTGDETVAGANKEDTTLRQALTTDFTITTPDKKFLKAVAEKADNPELGALVEKENKDKLADYLWGREIIDVLLENPSAKFEAAEFAGLLRKLTVRLYSIASSLAAHPDEVHLTVATVTYESKGRARKGVCSTFLADRIDDDTEIATFISPGKGFRLPEPEEDLPIIMCGPGTGIAPFRAFLQHRKATNAKGNAWLIFGEQHAATDFFYEDEWNAYLEDGTLTRLDTAFSRDQDHKIYVQDRIRENGAEFYKWLEEGALFYVCGDAARMAGDVDKAIHELIAEHGGKSEEEAAEYVENLKKEKRYRRDVY